MRIASPCRGNGKEIKSTTLRFNIPAGAEAGTRLRMRGKGEPAPQGKGEDGDLFIEIDIEKHLGLNAQVPTSLCHSHLVIRI